MTLQDQRQESRPIARLQILVDDGPIPGLTLEHGFSVFVEAAGQRVLFDTGQGPALDHNAAHLGVDLRAVGTVVISHGHYDHTGGLPLALERAPYAAVYLHPEATASRFIIRDGSARSIAMPASAKMALERHEVSRVHWIGGPAELAPGLGLTGPVPRLTKYEDTGGPFFCDGRGRDPDPLEDDQALWLVTEHGLVVIVGCCHSGLINTLAQARRVSGVARVHAVLGGFHLLEANRARLERTMDALAVLNPDLIVPCHCTGDEATVALEQRFPEKAKRGSAGAVFLF